MNLLDISNVPSAEVDAIYFYMDSLEVLSCSECQKFFHSDNLNVCEEMEDLLCDHCVESVKTLYPSIYKQPEGVNL